jgi:hypothetical protein
MLILGPQHLTDPVLRVAQAPERLESEIPVAFEIPVTVTGVAIRVEFDSPFPKLPPNC